MNDRRTARPSRNGDVSVSHVIVTSQVVKKEYTRALIIPTLVCDVGNYVLGVASILLDPVDAFCSVILDVEQPFFYYLRLKGSFCHIWEIIKIMDP